MASRAESGRRWNHDGRRAERLNVQMMAALRASGSARFNVDVIDMSVVGFRFDTVSRLNIGDRVWLTVPGMAGMESIVVWRDRDHYGCAFASPLHTAVFDRIISRFRKPATADEDIG